MSSKFEITICRSCGHVKLVSGYFVGQVLILHHSCSQCYVDDTKLKLNFNLQDQANAIAKLNEDLCRISNWTFGNQLLINPNKTTLIIFGSRAMVGKVKDFRLTLLGKEIAPTAFAKDLGVILDSCLTYNDHIVSTVSIQPP